MTEIVGGMIGAGGLTALSAGAWLSWVVRNYREVKLDSATKMISADKYAVLQRLTSDDDLEFLRSLPGYTAKIEKDFLAERRRVFRAYLRELSSDFRTVHREAKALAAVAPASEADVVGSLLAQQVRFWRSLLAVELRLAMQWAGVPKVRFDAMFGAFSAVQEAGRGQVQA